MQLYKELKDEFIRFLNVIKSKNIDVVFIAHVTDTDENGVYRKMPSVAGKTKDKILQISDLIGFQLNQNMINS
jgi:hypothetical protein